MKKLLLAICLAISFTGLAQIDTLVKNDLADTVPDEVITNDSTHWTISTLSTVGYVNATPGAYYRSAVGI